jgi:signal transduction histidine kinase
MSGARRPVSTPLRLTGLLLAIFVGTLLVSFAASYVVIRNNFDGTLRDQLRQKIEDYAALPAGDLQQRLLDDIARTDPSLLILSWTSDTGQRLSNVKDMPAIAGFRIVPESEIDGDDINDSYLAYGRRVGDGQLTVAMTRAQLVDMAEIFVTVLLLSLLPTLVVATGLGIFFAQRARQRIDAVSLVLKDLQAGNLAARVALDPRDRDDLSVIGAAVNDMAEAQGAAMDSLRQATADIAHDLRTPIQRVAVTLDRLRRQTELSADQTIHVDQALAETDRIARTFEALLRIAQIEGGAVRERFVRVDLQDIAELIVDMFEAAAGEAGHRLSLSTEGRGPFLVTGDRDLLGQVLSNLIENSLRHVPAGGRIDVSLSHQDGRCILRVADDGPGVPEEERAKVLRRLYRLERSRTTPGNGLGLSMVAAIAELHGATLTLADNAPGLTVSVAFPAP